jgi:hypothetical protein
VVFLAFIAEKITIKFSVHFELAAFFAFFLIGYHLTTPIKSSQNQRIFKIDVINHR